LHGLLNKTPVVMHACDDKKRFQQTSLHTAVMLSEAVIKYALPAIGTA